MRRPRAARTVLQFAIPGRVPSAASTRLRSCSGRFLEPPMTTPQFFHFDVLSTLVGGRCGRFDVPCPACGPLCRAVSNRRRRVLRVWRNEPEFISFYCARCGQRGFAKDCESPTPALRDLERVKARAAAAVQRQHADLVQNTARALAIWNDAQPICGTLAEQYLKRRGLVVPDECGRVLRFHPCCPFGNQRRLPSMVALMRNIQIDAPQAINRTALSPDGGRIERKMLGPKRGAAVKLPPDERADSKFHAFTVAGKLMGHFTTRIEASRSIPPPSISTARGAR
jgi:hypothetical protein